MKLYNSIRLLQFLRARRSSGEELPSEQIRVSPDRYRQNITAIRDNLTALGSSVILLTAPTSHTTWGVPDYIIDMHFARSKQEALSFHAQYNDIVREAASGDSCLVFDLEERFHGKEYRRLFWPDGIHFSKLGERAVAQSLTAFIVEQNQEIFGR
jgi:lysophospholipase L1-like esterase